jgi:hypothetical protein
MDIRNNTGGPIIINFCDTVRKYSMLIILLLTLTCCESDNNASLDPLLVERSFCPYVRVLDAFCNGDKEYHNDEQWIKVIEAALATEGIEIIEIKLGFRNPVNGVIECPCGAITGHYADVLVAEENREKLMDIGFLALTCENTQ